MATLSVEHEFVWKIANEEIINEFVTLNARISNVFKSEIYTVIIT